MVFMGGHDRRMLSAQFCDLPAKQEGPVKLDRALRAIGSNDEAAAELSCVSREAGLTVLERIVFAHFVWWLKCVDRRE